MKLKQQVFCLTSVVNKYKALANVNVLLPANRIVHSATDLYSINNCHDELQIRYANLRV
ncbi:hypothetical protein [Flavobacterium rivuli]|uniref:hypothetical protein n=1 Tax=Flavobacterium rivuli TaxID=498301 RepID=UPI00035F2D99|nr:hypothetical protein [Flavobacterium rivuli]